MLSTTNEFKKNKFYNLIKNKYKNYKKIYKKNNLYLNKIYNN